MARKQQLSKRLLAAHECATQDHMVIRWTEWLEVIHADLYDCDAITDAVFNALSDGTLDHVLRAWLARREAT